MPEDRRREIGARGRQRVLREHTAAHRAAQLESYVRELSARDAMDRRPGAMRVPKDSAHRDHPARTALGGSADDQSE
jgi:hypothetical protein